MTWKIAAPSIVSFFAGLMIGASFFDTDLPRATYRQEGVFTRPLLGFEFNTEGRFEELDPIERDIKEFIAGREREGEVKTVSAYFRLLNSGRWFAVNKDERYSPASLLKVPIMMSYFKQAEDNPEILQERLQYDGTFGSDEQTTIPAERRVQKGTSYTIGSLIEKMILDSNNVAKDMLEMNLSKDFVSHIYLEMNVQDPYGKSGDYMSVAEYPFFLRVLYNSTYLSQAYSEKALELLSRSGFKEGLPAKLPSDIQVAHKFGYRVLDTGAAELHDCGIIYYPEHPYLLCIMTKGYAYEPLLHIVQDLSELTHKGVEDFFSD